MPVPTKQATRKPRQRRPWNRGWTTIMTVRNPRDRIYVEGKYVSQDHWLNWLPFR